MVGRFYQDTGLRPGVGVLRRDQEAELRRKAAKYVQSYLQLSHPSSCLNPSPCSHSEMTLLPSLAAQCNAAADAQAAVQRAPAAGGARPDARGAGDPGGGGQAHAAAAAAGPSHGPAGKDPIHTIASLGIILQPILYFYALF